MNWKERFKPSNMAEAGCLSFLVGFPLAVVAIILDFRFIPQIAVGGWLIFYAFRFGYQVHATYEVPKTTAVVVSGLLVFAYSLIWIGVLSAIMFALSDFIGQDTSWLLFIFSFVLAYALYSHFVRFKQTVYENWLGWQPKEGVVDG
ncbi:MAG: hypothetical protein R3D55_20960 [Chloroflexota bacterium]